MAINNQKITSKVLTLPAIALICLIGQYGIQTYFSNKISNDVVMPEFGNAVLEGRKQALKSAIDIECALISENITQISDVEQQRDVIKKLTHNARFMDDRSGYVFTFTFDGICIYHPDKTSLTGTDMSQSEDAQGKLFIQEFNNVAKEKGEGFVEYQWDKNGETQPKISYIKAIPGTNLYIGAGVYADNVQKAKDILTETVNGKKHEYAVFNIIGLTISLTLLIIISTFMTRSIIKPLKKAVEILAKVVNDITQASDTISQGANSLADSANSQAAAVEETSSSLEEISSMAKITTDNAGKANSLAANSSKIASTGSHSIEQMSSAMQGIQNSSQEISNVIKIIDEIAFQTNLLALNAAVEAARAGEAGKGFAVVAEEVRNLAMRSAEAAKGTAQMIEESVRSSQNGVRSVTEVSDAFGEMSDASQKVNDLISEIYTASNEQAIGIQQINTAMSRVDTSTQSIAANAEEDAAAAQQLKEQVQYVYDVTNELKSMI